MKDRRNLDEVFDQEILIAMIALRGFDDATRKGIKVGTCEGRRVAAWDAGNVSYLMVSDLTKDALLVMANQVVKSASQSLK